MNSKKFIYRIVLSNFPARFVLATDDEDAAFQGLDVSKSFKTKLLDVQHYAQEKESLLSK